jgi:hypothetical protein
MLKIALCSVRTTCGHDIKQNTREKNYCRRDDCVSSRHTDQAIRAAALGKGNTCRSVTMVLVLSAALAPLVDQGVRRYHNNLNHSELVRAEKINRLFVMAITPQP